MNLVERLFALRSAVPFAGLYDSELAAIAEVTKVRVLSPGEVVQRAGRPVRHLHVVAEGALVDAAGATLPTTWGERYLVTGRDAPEEIRAHPDRGATCLLIPRPHVLTLVHESPSVLLALLDAPAGDGGREEREP